MWSRLADESVVDEAGRIIFFSTERFINDICLGNCCFICGASPESVPFNDEHVIPEWVLRRFDLFSMQVTLPNGHRVRYDQYKVPCCEACNSLMGREIEAPISKLFRAGPAAVAKHLANKGSLKFFVWLGLIFLKTHLKDRSHRYYLDQRKGSQVISDEYEWDPRATANWIASAVAASSFSNIRHCCGRPSDDSYRARTRCRVRASDSLGVAI
jgi:hypothetical protein